MSCYGCNNESIDVCPKSKKDCGHHGNEYWVLGICGSCGKEMIDNDYLEDNQNRKNHE